MKPVRILVAASLLAVLATGVGTAQAAERASSSSTRAIAAAAAPGVVLVNVYEQVGKASSLAGKRFRKVSLGTAFFVTGDGYLLTSRHVVADPDAFYTIDDGDGQVLATVLYRDSERDVAVLKVAGTGYPALPLGDSEGIRKGDRVIGIGNAEGDEVDSVSTGKVTHLGVELSVVDDGKRRLLEDMIRTTARHYHGDSGGPLLDAAGKVVGINTAIGVGRESRRASYAFPIDLARAALAIAGL